MIELNQFDGLYVDIGAPVSVNPLQYSLSWVDYPVAGSPPSNGSDTVGSAGPQLLVSGAAGAGIKRFVRTLALTNDDTDPHAVAIELGNGGFYFKKVQAVLTPGDQLHYEDHRGWYALNANGDSRGGGGGGGPTGPAGGPVLSGSYPNPDWKIALELPSNTQVQSTWSAWRAAILWLGAWLSDFTLGDHYWLVLNANVSLSFAAFDGQIATLVLQQDGAGNHRVTWPANTHFAAGGPPMLSDFPNATDVFQIAVLEISGVLHYYITPLLLTDGQDGRVRWRNSDLAHSSISPLNLFTLPGLGVMLEARVIVDTSFDGAPTLSLGNTTNGPAYYLSTSDVDLTAAAGTAFVVYPSRLAAFACRAVQATYVAGGATVGQARILMAWAAPQTF